jgi:hypothetical protein
MRVAFMLASVTACLLGCTGLRLAIELPTTEPWTLDEFQGARLARECMLASGDPRRGELQEWLDRNDWGWTRSPRFFPPGTLVRGSTFALNLSPIGVAVLSYGGVQYTKDSFRGKLPELRCPPPSAVRPR